MAQLKDTLVSGSLRATDTLFSNTLLTDILKLTDSTGTTYSPGASGGIIFSNGTRAYWGATTEITTLGTVNATSITLSDTLSAASGRFGYTNTTYALSANTAIINSWIRTKGATGWYNEDYGGGWYMPGSSYVKMYGNKLVVISSSYSTTADNLSSLLIISPIAYSSDLASTAGGKVALELWRGSNASWQIINDSGDLHFKCNYTTTKLATYTQDSVKIAYNTGDVTLTGDIYYKGTQAALRMIRFIDNTSDTSGNGIAISGGGLTMLGSGESANTLITNLSLTGGGTEQLYISSDNDIHFYATLSSYQAGYKMTLSSNKLTVGVDANTSGEALISCASGSGTIRLYSNAATNGNRGLYVLAHGTGAAKSIITVDTNNVTTFDGTISRAGANKSWYQGRDSAIIKNTSYSGYDALISFKTTSGSWDMGTYTDNKLYLSYILDSNYSSNLNTITALLCIDQAGNISIGDEKHITFKVGRKKASGGGWDYQPLWILDNDGTNFAHIGVYGANDTMTYMYIGANAYNSANNLRITPNGTVVLPNSTDASGTAANTVALVIGGEQTAEHIEIDSNEILAKTNGTTPGTLYLQDGAGTVLSSGTGGLIAKNGRLKTRSSENFPGIDFISNDSTGATGGTIAMSMGLTNSKYRADRFYFRCYTYDSSTGASSSVYEQFRLPETTAGRSSNQTYDIITTKGVPGNIPILQTITKGTKPSSSVSRLIAFTDSTGSTASDHLLGLIYNYVGTDGLARMRMYVHDNIASATSSSYFGIYHTTQSASTLVRRTEGNVKIYGAVWNDYAEYRASYTEEPGRVVLETPEGKLKLVNERLAPGARIISDTFGFAIGETKEYNAPIAVSGRVLVYTYKDRNEYSLGAAVCSAPNGTVDIMTRDEIMMYPERILGTVSEIPKYEYWYGGDGTPEDKQAVAVNNRIWIYVR